MILYLDTSCLAKICIEEEGSPEVRSSAATATRLATSRVGYAEFRAVLARARRGNRLTTVQFTSIRSNFDTDWQQMLVVEAADDLVRFAGDLADLHFVRGFDAIHLASAIYVRAGNAAEVRFAAADGRLRDAAIAEGFAVGP